MVRLLIFTLNVILVRFGFRTVVLLFFICSSSFPFLIGLCCAFIWGGVIRTNLSFPF